MHKMQLLLYQDQMEDTSFPFLNSFQTVTGNVILNLLSLHECSQNGLINRIV